MTPGHVAARWDTRPNDAAIAAGLAPEQTQPLGALGSYHELETDVGAIRETMSDNIQIILVRALRRAGHTLLRQTRCTRSTPTTPRAA